MCPGQCCYSLCLSQHPSQSSVLASKPKRDFLRARVLQIHSGWLQAFWHHRQQQRQNHFVPSYSSAADSGNLHEGQLMGERPHCHPSSAPSSPEKGIPFPPPELRSSNSAETKRGKAGSQKLLETWQTVTRIISMEQFVVARLSSLPR